MSENIFELLKHEVIDHLGAILTSPMPSQFWCDVKAFVSDVANNQHLSSHEKHEKVRKDLKFIFVDDLGPVLEIFGETFIDVAIKLAVMYLTAINPMIGLALNEGAKHLEESIEADIAEKQNKFK